MFNHVQWGRADRGEGFITPHRDPPGATGVIAILTIDGAAIFGVWDEDSDRDHHWETAAGDLVVLRGHGWPTSENECPRHEVEPIADGSRSILTLRHNRSGYGGDYFK